MLDLSDKFIEESRGLKDFVDIIFYERRNFSGGISFVAGVPAAVGNIIGYDD